MKRNCGSASHKNRLTFKRLPQHEHFPPQTKKKGNHFNLNMTLQSTNDLFGNQHVIAFPSLANSQQQQQTNQLKIHTIQFNSNKLSICAFRHEKKEEKKVPLPASSTKTTSFAYLRKKRERELIP